jgi:iron complex transport system substrate-binding protein
MPKTGETMLRKLLSIILLATLVLTACSSLSPAWGKLTFTDGLGREVKLNGPAQRVVSMAPSNTEILFAIGAGKQVIGRDALSDYPEEAKSLPDIGSTFDKLNTEQIVALKPDLVLAAEINTPEQVKQLEDLGLTVYYLKNPLTLEEMYGNLEIAAKLTGHEKETATLIDSLKKRVAAVDEKIAPISSRPNVFYELDATDPAKPYTAGKGTFITQLIDRAGGHNIAADLDGYPQMSLEQVVAADPAFIILGDARYGVSAETIAQRPGWENLSAVKNGKVLPFNDDLVSRPGPRLVDALEELAKLLRPGLFQ